MSTKSSYGRKAAGGAAYMGLAQAVSIGTTTVMTVIVARLLSPGDYGVVAMAAPVTAFLLMFRHLGLNHATVQAKTLTYEQSNALFWVNMAASAAVMLGLLALAPVVAWFYGDPRPGYITAASAATVLAGGSTLQHAALLNREMRFDRLGMIDIASSFMTLIATVAAAWLLRSYWALWIGAFLATIFSNVLTWLSSRFRPSFKVSFNGIGQMVRFGGALTGFNILNFLHRNLDNVLIGKLWGSASLGLYDRSYRLMMFPLQNINAPLGRVILPVLSRLQDEPERYRRSYLLTVRAIMLAAIPAVAVAASTSERLVLFLLGERWAGAAPIFFWLSLAAFMQPIGNSTGWLFISSGRAGAMLRWGAIYMTLMIPTLLFAVQFGAVGVAKAYFALSVLTMPMQFAYSVRGTALKARDLYAACLPPVAAAALTWAIIHWLLEPLSTVPLLAVALPLSYGLALAILWLSRSGRDTVTMLASLATSSVKARYRKHGTA